MKHNATFLNGLLVVFVLCAPKYAVQRAPLTVPAVDNVPTEEGYVVGAEGVRLFYRLAGNGDVIVFLHGGPGLGIDDGGYDLEPLAAKGHALLMVNERGAGRSEVVADPARLGIDSYVRDLEAVREQFKLPRMALIGLSWGSAVVAKYTSAYPDRVSRVVFLSPMGLTKGSNARRAERLRSMLSEPELARMREVDGMWDSASDEEPRNLCRESLMPVLALYVTNPEHLKRSRGDVCGYVPDAIRNMNRVGEAGGTSLGEWDFRPDLRAMSVPALVIEGAESNVPLNDAREWARTIRDGRLLLIPNAGHMNWLDQPSAVIAALHEFFTGSWPASAQR